MITSGDSGKEITWLKPKSKQVSTQNGRCGHYQNWQQELCNLATCSCDWNLPRGRWYCPHWTLEHRTQHLYPLELTCDSAKETGINVPSLDNYWLRLSMISWIAEAEGWSRQHRHEGLVIHDIMQKPREDIHLLRSGYISKLRWNWHW